MQTYTWHNHAMYDYATIKLLLVLPVKFGIFVHSTPHIPQANFSQLFHPYYFILSSLPAIITTSAAAFPASRVSAFADPLVVIEMKYLVMDRETLLENRW